MAEAVFTRIVVPTDFSAQSEKAWQTARRLARALGAELHLVHVFVEAPLYSESFLAGDRVRGVYAEGRAWAETALARLADAARAEGLVVRTSLREGAAAAGIVSTAREERADLVVIGTHGRGGLDRALLGSVADRVIRLAPCPVLAVREGE
jgi:nucleotide-binding universal stress UspA family protein